MNGTIKKEISPLIRFAAASFRTVRYEMKFKIFKI